MKKYLNDKSGFTLIEMLIVLAVIGIISNLILLSYNKNQNSKELVLEREQILGDIRMTQSYSYYTLKFGTVFPKGGYGIHFDTNASKSYIIFADVDGNKTYDLTEKYQEMELPRSVEISSLIVNGTTSVSSVDLIFQPPYDKVSIGNSYTKLEIKIKNSNNETRTITAEDSGLTY